MLTSLGSQLQTHRFLEVGHRFVGRESQVGGADLEQFTACSQACERQWRIDSTGQHEADPWWQVVEQEPHGLLHVG